MKPLTMQMFEKLYRSDMFSKLGAVAAYSTDEILAINNWNECEFYINQEQWENAQLDAAGELTVNLCFLNKERYNQWSEILNEVKELFLPLIDKKIESSLPFIQDNRIYRDSIRWDICQAAMEYEYADVYDYRFARDLVDWYTKGHLPCGWAGGEFPEGKLVVF